MKKVHPIVIFQEIIAATFVLLFLYTAITKLKDIPFFIGSMEHSPVLRPVASFLGGFIPAIELATVLLLVFPTTRRLGLFISTILMAGFTCYTAYILSNGQQLPCSCGGVLEQMGWSEHLVFNSIFLLLGIISLISHKRFIAINRRSRTPAT